MNAEKKNTVIYRTRENEHTSTYIHITGRLQVSRKKAGLPGLLTCKCLCYKEIVDLHKSSVQYQINTD